MVKCYVCKFVEVEPKKGERQSACERCEEILKAPACLACGQPVRGMKKGDPAPAYHEECRRCSSCQQLCRKDNAKFLAGKLLCTSCDELFGSYFVPSKRTGADLMEEAFNAWDRDGSGWIDKDELRRVLAAIMPNFSDRDMNELVRTIDTNGNGVVEYSEFCAWVTKDRPLEMDDETFSAYVASLMREAGKWKNAANMDIDMVQVRSDGVYVSLRSGTVRKETSAFRNEDLQVTSLDPEEFITRVECTEAGLVLGLNTGREVTLPGNGALFGPFAAPPGFHVDGLRTKPSDAAGSPGVEDFVAGIDLAPLAKASLYDAPTALMYTAEQEFLRSLREILAKAATDVNSFGPGGITALMLSASRGATGAMRLLMSSKANPSLADAEGWTALTYASRCGSQSAVEALLEKGAREDGGDNSALKEALRSKFNSSARALLRAGLGPAPAGSFALEAAAKGSDCGLAAPKLSPPGGAFSHPRRVSIMIGDVDATKGPPGVKVWYTLDGRDPISAGHRYIGAITVTKPFTKLRAVAALGPRRSQVVEADFVVCHCALPDEIVHAAVRAKLFPGATHMLKMHTAAVLEMSEDSLQIETKQVENDSAGKWLQVTLVDLKPRHRLVFDMSFGTIKSADKKKKWLDKIEADITKAVGETPENLEVFAGSGVTLEFQMTRAKAEDILKQLQDPDSFLCTKAKQRKLFKTATMQMVDALGARLSDAPFRTELEQIMKTKKLQPEVKSVGEGDQGAVACYVSDKKEAKAVKPKLLQAIRKQLEDVESAEMEEFTEQLELDINVDVMKAGASKSILDALNNPETTQKISDLMAIMEGIDAPMNVSTAASSRRLAELDVIFRWEEAAEWGLDCSCFVYAEDNYVSTINMKAMTEPEEASGAEVSKDGAQMNKLARSATKSILMSLDSAESAQEQRMKLELSALAAEVTDLFFVMSAYVAEDMSGYGTTSVNLIDSFREKEMSSFSFSPPASKAAVVGKLSRHGSGWVFHTLCWPVDATVERTDELMKLLSDAQSFHAKWDRRKDMVLLRALHKCERMSQDSTAEFAKTMGNVMDLPLAAFQNLVNMF